MDNDIPALRPLEDLDPIVSEHDLFDFWRMIAGPWGFSEPQTFAVVLEPDGRLLPTIVNVKPWPTQVESDACDALADRLGEVVEAFAPDGSCAVMWARPGGDVVTPDDLDWYRSLTRALSERGLDRWPVFVANDHRVRAVAGDDLIPKVQQ